MIVNDDELPEIAVNNVEIQCPYTIVPKKQAKFPIKVKIANNTQFFSQAFWINAKVKHENSTKWPFYHEPDMECYDDNGDGYCDVCHQKMGPWSIPGYYENLQLFFDPCIEGTCSFPKIDLMKGYDSLITKEYNRYYLSANRVSYWEDLFPENDTIYNDFSITFGKVFAYDPPDERGINDIPSITGFPGRGLNLLGNSDGTGSLESAIGVPGGNGSGQIAMKFNLVQPDTIFGFQAYFASFQQSVDDVTFAIYENNNGIPGKQVPGSLITRQRGIDNIRKSWILDEYTTYLYETPVILPAGTYWASVGQPQEYGFELGASAYRMGMVTTNYSDKEELGKNSNYVMINNQFKKDTANPNPINDSFFAYENIHGSGNWKPFAPVKGNPGYAHLDAEGTVNGAKTYTRGTWIPMIRPYLDGSHYIVSVPEDNIPNSSSIEIFPNPVINNAVIIYSVTRNSIPSCNISIYDVIGNKQLDISCAYKESGKNLINFSTENLAPGVYFCRLNNSKEVKSLKFVVIK